MADGSPLKRTVALSPVALPGGGGVVGNALAGLGDAPQILANQIGHDLRVEQDRRTAEQRRLEEAAERARTQAGLIDARLGAQSELNDLYSSFDKDEDPATAPDRFREGATKIREKYAGKLSDPEAVNSFTLGFGEMTEARRVTLQTESIKRETAGAVATLDKSLDVFGRQAAEAKNEAERNAALDAADAGIQGLVDAGMISAVDGQARTAKFKKDLSTLDARRFVFADPVKAKAALEDGAFANLDPLDRQTLIERAQAEIEQRDRALTAAKIEARQVARDYLGQIGDVVEAGYPVAPELFSQAQRAIADAGEPALVSRYNELARASGMVERLRGATPLEVQAALADLDARAAKGATGDLAAAANAARKFYGTMTETLAKDPLAWASRQGVATITPLQLDGSDTPEAWKARVRTAEMVAARYGVAPVYLTDSETDALKTTLATGSADDKIKTLAMVGRSLGSRAPAVLQTIAKDQPVAAHVAGMLMPGASSDQVNAARDALRGEALLNGPDKEGAGDLRPGAAARASERAIEITQALGLSPEDRARVMQTAEAIYAARAARLGLRGVNANPNSSDFTSKARQLYEQSLNDALGATRGKDGRQYGGLTEYRGAPVVAPASLAVEDFEDTIHSLKDADLVAGSMTGMAPVIAGRTFTATDLRRSYLVSIGDGQYAISVTDPSRGEPSIVQDALGRPYKLDVAKVPRFDFANVGRSSIGPGRLPNSPLRLGATPDDDPPIEAGNIDVNGLPAVKNADGTVSTVRTETVYVTEIWPDAAAPLDHAAKQQAINIPTIIDGKAVSRDEAIEHVRTTGRHLGVWPTIDIAVRKAKKLHEDEERRVSKR